MSLKNYFVLYIANFYISIEIKDFKVCFYLQFFILRYTSPPPKKTLFQVSFEKITACQKKKKNKKRKKILITKNPLGYHNGPPLFMKSKYKELLLKFKNQWSNMIICLYLYKHII